MTLAAIDALPPACHPLPATSCRCDDDLPCQDPGEAARCAKCGLRLAPERARAVGALPEQYDEASAAPPPAEDAEVRPASALRGPGPMPPDTQDGRPRRDRRAAGATARVSGPGSPQLPQAAA